MGEKDMHESELNAAQPARHPRKKKRGRAGKVIRKTVKIVVVLVLAVGAGLFGLKAYIGKQAEENQGESYSRAAVTRGAMEETVYGTGTTAARNQTNVLAGADGTLTDLRVSVGDEVKAGDILAVLTNADLDDEITDLEFDLWELDDTILDTGTGSKVTAVEAPAAGRVMAVYARRRRRCAGGVPPRGRAGRHLHGRAHEGRAERRGRGRGRGAERQAGRHRREFHGGGHGRRFDAAGHVADPHHSGRQPADGRNRLRRDGGRRGARHRHAGGQQADGRFLLRRHD